MRMHHRFLAAALGAAVLAPGCASSLEVPIETPLKSKLDVSKFRRVLVAGFVTDLVDEGIDLAPETARLIQNQLRSASRLQVIEPDRPPLNQALAKAFKPTEDVRVTRDDRDRYRAEGERILQDTAFWRKLGEEFQNPLIVTGKLAFEEQNRSGFQQESALVRDNRGRVIERFAGTGTPSGRPSIFPPTSPSSTEPPGACSTRSASPKRLSTARNRRSRPSPPISNSWTVSCPIFSA